jgi:hypothetical protein
MFGFVMMTPQLFINYKLQSVAHLNWRTMTYKSINTFIDDLFGKKKLLLFSLSHVAFFQHDSLMNAFFLSLYYSLCDQNANHAQVGMLAR